MERQFLPILLCTLAQTREFNTIGTLPPYDKSTNMLYEEICVVKSSANVLTDFAICIFASIDIFLTVRR